MRRFRFTDAPAKVNEFVVPVSTAISPATGPALGSGHVMTLVAMHQRFLQHCAVETRLRPMIIVT